MDFYIRTYTRHTKEDWGYLPLEGRNIEQFYLAYTNSGGGVSGEFKIECRLIDSKEVFKVSSFSDSIKCLLGFSDILMQLSPLDEEPNIADKIEKILVDNGVLRSSNIPDYFKIVSGYE